METSIRVLLALILAVSLSRSAHPQDPPADSESPAGAPAFAKEDADGGLPPLDADRVRTLLARSEANVRLHGLTLNPRYLRNAVTDYMRLHTGLGDETGLGGLSHEEWEDARFTSAFALAFCLAREDLPLDPEERASVLHRIEECLQVASIIQPQSGGLWLLDGMGRERAGDFKGAIPHLNLGLEFVSATRTLAPWQVRQLRLFGLLSRGRAYLGEGMGREDLAVADFREAEKLVEIALRSPEMPREGSNLRQYLLTHMAAAQQKLNQFGEAEATLDLLLSEDPGNAMHAYNRGLVAAWQQKFDVALKFYRRSASLDRSDPAPHIKIAYILLSYHPGLKGPDLRGAREAAGIYRNLAREETDEYYTCMGEVALLEGDNATAETWFLKALEKNPRCTRALQRLVRLMGLESDRDPDRQKRFEDYGRRLTEIIRMKQDGEGMETGRSDMTFC